MCPKVSRNWIMCSVICSAMPIFIYWKQMMTNIIYLVFFSEAWWPDLYGCHSSHLGFSFPRLSNNKQLGMLVPILLWLIGDDWRKVPFDDQCRRWFKLATMAAILDLVSVDYLTNAWVDLLSTSRMDTWHSRFKIDSCQCVANLQLGPKPWVQYGKTV
jgi:hypothetical protein